jgi:hypothetical protein
LDGGGEEGGRGKTKTKNKNKTKKFRKHNEFKKVQFK